MISPATGTDLSHPGQSLEQVVPSIPSIYEEIHHTRFFGLLAGSILRVKESFFDGGGDDEDQDEDAADTFQGIGVYSPDVEIRPAFENVKIRGGRGVWKKKRTTLSERRSAEATFLRNSFHLWWPRRNSSSEVQFIATREHLEETYPATVWAGHSGLFSPPDWWERWIGGRRRNESINLGRDSGVKFFETVNDGPKADL